MSDSTPLAVRISPGAYEAHALPRHPDAKRLKRSMQALPTMSTGYDPLRERLIERDRPAPLGHGGDRHYRTATYEGWTKRSLRDRPALTAPECYAQEVRPRERADTRAPKGRTLDAPQ
jgi:hypothetical protein